VKQDNTTRILVTGGAGFIGSALVRQLISNTDVDVLTFDKLTYAGHTENLESAADSDRHQLIVADVADRQAVRGVFESFKPTAVMHLAAESHVDRSIMNPDDFIRTNVMGTYVFLDEALAYWQSLDSKSMQGFRFIHVSTDEVFGSLGDEGTFNEKSQYQPNSPYSASKAGADHLARAWFSTYRLPVIITNCSNNYGPYQYPEKLIPVIINNALSGTPMPIYGAGDQVRDWLHVDDHVGALMRVLNAGQPGETYCIASGEEVDNLHLVHMICELLDDLVPTSKHVPHKKLISHVTDRLGHDKRYAMDWRKIETSLDWRPSVSLRDGLSETVSWYLGHQDWTKMVLPDAKKTTQVSA